jgi:hypothetical protein
VKKKRKRKKNGGGESLVQIAQVSECPKGGKYELLGSFFSIFFFFLSCETFCTDLVKGKEIAMAF